MLHGVIIRKGNDSVTMVSGGLHICRIWLELAAPDPCRNTWHIVDEDHDCGRRMDGHRLDAGKCHYKRRKEPSEDTGGTCNISIPVCARSIFFL